MIKIKVDPHNHITHWMEDFSKQEDLVKKAVEIASLRLGPEGVMTITNAQDKGKGRFETFVRCLENIGGTYKTEPNAEKDFNAVWLPHKELYIIKTQEMFTEQGHTLVLGGNAGTNLKDYRPIIDTVQEAEDKGLAKIADHPCGRDGIVSILDPELLKKEYFHIPTLKLEGVLEKLEGFEVHNGGIWVDPGFRKANKSAKLFYEVLRTRYELGAMSCSDGHTPQETGSSYTILEKPDFSSPDRLRETLKKSIREHRNYSKDKQTNSLVAINHLVATAILRAQSKFGSKGRVN